MRLKRSTSLICYRSGSETARKRGRTATRLAYEHLGLDFRKNRFPTRTRQLCSRIICNLLGSSATYAVNEAVRDAEKVELSILLAVSEGSTQAGSN